MNHEVNKMKKLLVEIMLNPNWVESYDEYKFFHEYKMHMTMAGILHHKGYTKYGKGGNKVYPNYVITERGKKWLDKQKGEHDGTNE
jgi:hypothetical protein